MRNQSLKQFSTPLQVLLVCGVGLVLGIVSAMTPSLFVIAAIFGIIYLVLVWFFPEIAILALLLFSSTIFDMNTVLSLPIGIGHLIITDLLLFVPLAIIFLRVWAEPGIQFVHTPLDFPLIAFYAVAVLSTVLAINQSRVSFNGSLGELRAVNFYLIFFMVTNSIRTEKQLRRFLTGFFFLALFVALAMILQYFMGNSVVILPGRVETLGTGDTTSFGVIRVLPPGQSVVLVALIALPIIMIFDQGNLKFLNRLVQLLVIAAAVLLTFNRSFWVALVLALLLVLFLISVREKVRFIKVGFIVILIGAFLMIPVLLLLGDRAQTLIDGSVTRLSSLVNPNTINEGSLQDRYVENEYAIPKILENPVIGLGLGAQYRKRDNRIDYDANTERWSYIHDGHLWMILKTGFLGYAFFIWTLLVFIRRGFQGWLKNPPPFQKAILFAFVVTVVGLLPATIVNPIFAAPYWTGVISVMLGVSEVILHLQPRRTLDSVVEDQAA